MTILTNPTVRKILLAAIILNVVLPIGHHFGEREEAAEFGAQEGVTVAMTTFALAGLYIPFLAQGRLQRSRVTRPARGTVPLLCYVVFIGLSLFVASDTELAFFELCLFVELLLLYMLVVKTTVSESEVLFLARMLILAVAIESVLIIALWAGMGHFSFMGVKTRVDENLVTDITRIGGTLGSPNDVAAVLSLGLILAAGTAVAPVKRAYRVIAVIALVLGVTGLILTFSRGGSSGFLLGLAIVVLAAKRRRLITWKAPIAACVVVLLICAAFSDTLARRLLEDDNGAAQSRFPLMSLASRMIADHPLMGVGANNFGVAMEPYLAPEFSGEFLYAVHNRYLLVWSETGIGGLAAFLWFLLATLYRAFRCWRFRDPVLSTLAIACAASITGNMLHMCVDVFRCRSIMQTVILVAAMIAIIENLLIARRSTASGAPVMQSEPVSV